MITFCLGAVSLNLKYGKGIMIRVHLSFGAAGIGYGMIFANYYGGISYNIIITYSLYYLFSSFTKSLPWVGCDHSWNTIFCLENYDECIETGDSIIINNGSCANLTTLNETQLDYYGVERYPNGSYDLSGYKDPLDSNRERSVEEFWM